MSVLLRQPHGFEGLRLARVELPVDDQAVPERVDLSVLSQAGSRSPWSAPASAGQSAPLRGPRRRSVRTRIGRFPTRPATLASTASRPRVHGRRRAVQHRRLGTASHSTSGSRAPDRTRSCPRGRPREATRNRSTFSCDIAYSDSPTASRASAWLAKSRKLRILPSRNVASCAISARRFNPVIRPVPVSSPSARTESPRSRMSSYRAFSWRSTLKLCQACRIPACPRNSSRSADHRDLGVEVLDPRVEVVAIPRVEGGSHDLHVLLRHRPRSIPQAQESA